MDELEDESSAAVTARRRQRRSRWLLELAVGLSFVVMVLGADRFVEASPPSPTLASLCIAGAIGVLALWFIVYIVFYRRLDEFEKSVELETVAIAGGLTVLFAAAWGLGEAFLGAQDFPLAFIAPLFSALYAVIRTLIALRYR